MRILVLTNFYPPHVIGGMEYRCQETVEGLKQRGHTVQILTSVYGQGSGNSEAEAGIFRLLHLESDLAHYRPLDFFIRRRRREQENRSHLQQRIRDFDPDIIFVWGMWNLSKTLAAYCEAHLAGRVVYALANDWPAQEGLHIDYWKLPARRWPFKPLKWALGQIALGIVKNEPHSAELQFNYALCVSQTLRDNLLQAGVPLKDVRVSYPGIDIEQFTAPDADEDAVHERIRLELLYAGSVVSHKGVHTAVEAMANLCASERPMPITLTIVGSGHPDYEARLRTLVKSHGLESHVHFESRVSRIDMPELLAKFDALLFPSIWEEPFARIVLEAMAAGVVVIGTRTGGTSEILVDGVNGLTFPPEDSAALWGQIQLLWQCPALRNKLAISARKTVAEHYTLERMIDETEDYLLSVFTRAQGGLVRERIKTEA